MRLRGALLGLLAARLARVTRAYYDPLEDVLALVEEAAQAGGQHHSPRAPCAEPAYVFLNYTPSAWEADWLAHADEYEDDICGALWRKEAWVREWAAVAAAHQGQGGPARHRVALAQEGAGHTPFELRFSRDVFPTFNYRRGCSARKGPPTLSIPIEPAVGHLRHPFWDDVYFQGGCRRVTPEETVGVEDRSYLLANALTPHAFHALYPGRALLLDLGTGPNYASSLGWLVDSYARQGVHFDEIWTWELAPMADQGAFWEGVPAGLRRKVHFYNTGISIGEAHPFAPVNLLREVYQPGDFVVLKMDVEGTEAIEAAVLRALLTTDLADLVSEMFWELHYGKAVFNSGITSATAFTTFHALRARGVRVHYWP